MASYVRNLRKNTTPAVVKDNEAQEYRRNYVRNLAVGADAQPAELSYTQRLADEVTPGAQNAFLTPGATGGVTSGAQAVNYSAGNAVAQPAGAPVRRKYSANLLNQNTVAAAAGVEDNTGTAGDGTTVNGAAGAQRRAVTDAVNKKLKVTSYEEYLGEGKWESTAEKYNADVDYAQGVKDDAYKEAEDEYRIAMRDADSNFRTSQPTYGAAAEDMLSNGLSGSGYSEYLAGKALEAKSDEAMAARSQMSYQKLLADQQYNSDVKTALDERYQTEQQLEADYKAKFQEVINGIMDGLWDASTGEKILAQYAPSAGISAEMKGALTDAQSNYDTANQGTVLGAYIDWCSSNDITINEATMTAYLKKTGKFTDSQISTYISNCFDSSGNFLGNTGDSEGDTVDPESPSDIIDTTTEFDQDDKGVISYKTVEETKVWAQYEADYGRPLTEEEKETIRGQFREKGLYNDEIGKFLAEQGNITWSTYLGISTNNFDQTVESFKESMLKHKIASGELQELLATLEANKGSVVSTAAAEAIKNMCEGLVVSAVALESNGGLRQKFQKGDNFKVAVGDEVYRVKSEGRASKEVLDAAADVPAGAVFGYGTDLYIKTENSAYKIKARAIFGNKDYDKLWYEVYGSELDNLKNYANGTRFRTTAEFVTMLRNNFTDITDYQISFVINMLSGSSMIHNGVVNLGDFSMEGIRQLVERAEGEQANFIGPMK